MLPKKLKKGDTIGILSPSSFVKDEKKIYIENAAKKFIEIGLNVVFSKNCFNKDKYKVSSGSPIDRAQDINDMFEDPSIDAIYCTQGGETANQVLRLIDFNIIKNNPKIFLGMSDVDVLSYSIYEKTGLVVFNASDPKIGNGGYLDIEYSWDSFNSRLFEKSKIISELPDRKCIRAGKSEGTIIGCNLISLTKLGGTKFFPNFQDKILFLEGQEMNTPRVIWELERLKQLGVFDKINGIVVGHITNFQNEKKRKINDIEVNFEELVLEATKDYDFPILKVNEFGHDCPNCFLPIGAKIRLDSEKKELVIIEDFLI